MALADSIEKHLVKSQNKCTLQIIMDMLPESDRKVLQESILKGLPTALS